MEKKTVQRAGKAGRVVDLQGANRRVAARLLEQWRQGQASAGPSLVEPPDMDYVLGLQRLEVLLEQQAPACMDAFHAWEGRLLDVLSDGLDPGSTPAGQAVLAGLDRLAQEGCLQVRLGDLCLAEQAAAPLGQDPVYLFRYLGLHLQEAGLFPDLLALVEDPAWCQAQHRQLGSHSSYLADLQRARQAAGERGAQGLPLLMHYSLIQALVQGSGGEVGVDALEAQAEAGDLQPALERASLIRDPRKRVDALLGIAQTSATRALPGFAMRVLSSVEAAIGKVALTEARAKAWIDVSAVKISLGDAAAAGRDLARGLDILPPLQPFTERQDGGLERQTDGSGLTGGGKPSRGASLDDERNDPDWVMGQMAAVNDYWAGQTFGELVAAYCSAVICHARLGQQEKAAALLEQMKQVMRQSDFSTGAVDALAGCAVQLARLDEEDLCGLAIEALCHRARRTNLFEGFQSAFAGVVGGHVRPGEMELLAKLEQDGREFGTRLGEFEDGFVTSPFSGPALLDASEILAKIGKPELAVRLAQKLGGSLERLRKEAMRKVVALTESPALLVRLARITDLAQDQAARNELVRKLARSGETAAAQTLAAGHPADLAVLAAVLLSVNEPEGQALLRQVMQAVKRQPDSEKRRETLMQIVQVLAEEGCCDPARNVWRQARASAAGTSGSRGENAARSAVAACLARSQRLEEALEIVQSEPDAAQRIPLLAAVAGALSGTGQRAQALALFQKAYHDAERLRGRDDRMDAMNDLLDRLLESREFDLAMQASKKLDRDWLADSVRDEPGLLFKMAKDRLARAVGFSADEDLAIDTAPDNQVKVIRAIAATGDYRLAQRLAAGIDNVSVQEDLLTAIAEAARDAGDLGTAISVVRQIGEESHLLEELQAQAAESGSVGSGTAAGSLYKYARAFPMFALDLQQASRGDRSAAERMALPVDLFCGWLSDPEDEARQFGGWALNVLLREAAYADAAAGMQLIVESLRKAMAKAKLAKREDECETAVENAFLILADAGQREQAHALIRELAALSDQGKVRALLASQVFFDSGIKSAQECAQVLANLELEDAYRRGLQDLMLGAAALGQCARGQFLPARQTAEQIAGEEYRRAVRHLISFIQVCQAGAIPGREAFPEPEELAVLPGLLLSFGMRSLVALGAGECARALASSLHGRPAGLNQGKRESPWWWEPVDDRMQQLAEDLARHGQLGEKDPNRLEDPALALIQSVSAAGRQRRDPGVPPWLFELIETELSSSRKLGGMTALVTWMAAVFPQAPERMLELCFDALNPPAHSSLWDALFTVAGLAPVLYAAGGPAMLNDMRRRLQVVEEHWITGPGLE